MEIHYNYHTCIFVVFRFKLEFKHLQSNLKRFFFDKILSKKIVTAIKRKKYKHLNILVLIS